jgi:ADP-heptose:LPS heptosyltransferase
VTGPGAITAPAPQGRVLVARLDSLGDILLTGGAVRAVAATAEHVTLLVGAGRGGVAELMPGVDDVVEFAAGWVDFDPAPIRPEAIAAFVATVRDEAYDAALIFTSYHQSPLPLALLLRLAGVGWVGAASEDYPGSLLDLRHREPIAGHEAERSLSLAIAAGFTPDADGAALAVRGPLPELGDLVGTDPYVVLHPGAAVPARRPSPEASRAFVAALSEAGYRVVVTGAAAETALAATVAGDAALDLAGRLRLPELAAVLAGAEVVIAPNTGPAHLAAAVGTPVVSLFAPVVPAGSWAPYGVPTVVLGDQQATCRSSRGARICPTLGHPCLDGIAPATLVAAVDALAPRAALAGAGGRTR